MNYKFKHVVAAGSWDHFHAGHRHFLKVAFSKSERVSVGVTTQAMVIYKPFAGSLEPNVQRKANIVDYVRKQGWLPRVTFETLDDIYGPAIVDSSIEALIVTPKTMAGGVLVNGVRKKRELPELQLIEVPLKSASDGGEISSQRIRAGEINREGLVYMDILRQNDYLKLPLRLRKKAQMPFGTLMPGIGSRLAKMLRKKLQNTAPVRLVCVGDVVTKLLLTAGLTADLYIVDLAIERERRYRVVEELGLSSDALTVLENPAGVIKGAVADLLSKALVLQIAGWNTILVEGEEDLLVLPVVLAAPLGSLVLYGQPHQGLVWVDVTEEKKMEAYRLVTKFTSHSR